MHPTTTRTAPNFADAGRQFLTTIRNLLNHFGAASHVQATEDMPVAASPVPGPMSTLRRVKTINKREGLAMLRNRRALLAQRESGTLASGDASAQACSLRRVGAVNKREGLEILKRRKARVPDEDFVIAVAGTIQTSSEQREEREAHLRP